MADRLNIPPYTNLESWESTTAPDMVDGYGQGAEAAHALPPSRGTPSPVLLIMLAAGHYYHVRVTPRPEDGRWDLEAVESMIPVTAPLPDAPSTLNPDQPPDPLAAVTSGQAGSWHSGHAFYCLWQWARRWWPDTRPWTAAWRFHRDGLQQAEAAPPQGVEDPPTTGNLCAIFAVHQIRAHSGRADPSLRTETAARAAYTALVHKIFDALRSAQIRPGTSQQP